jgi:hypothetical protein
MASPAGIPGGQKIASSSAIAMPSDAPLRIIPALA